MNIMRNRFGVSLTEVILAVSILALSVLPIAGMMSYTLRGTRDQDAEGIAANLAKEEMNRLLFVISQENLFENARTPRNWTRGNVEVKGNIFEGTYVVYPHDNASVRFTVSNFVFHDPQECSDGAESVGGVVGAPVTRTIAETYPAIGDALMADIIMRIRWRSPAGDFLPQNQLTLVARRTFLVRES